MITFPFLGALVDQYCGNDDGQTARVYSKYVDVVNLMFRPFQSPGWNEAELWEVLEAIIDSKKVYLLMLGKEPGLTAWNVEVALPG